MAAESVTNCGVTVDEIDRGLCHVLSPENRSRCRNVKNPYEQADTLQRIVDVVCNTPLDNIIIKPFYDLQ